MRISANQVIETCLQRKLSLQQQTQADLDEDQLQYENEKETESNIAITPYKSISSMYSYNTTNLTNSCSKMSDNISIYSATHSQSNIHSSNAVVLLLNEIDRLKKKLYESKHVKDSTGIKV